MNSKFTLSAVGPELVRVLEDRTIVLEKLNVQEVYFLFQACQAVVTHPALGQVMNNRFIALGRRMQELLRPRVSAFFAEFMEAGWDRRFDE